MTSPIFSLSNVIATPHISGGTDGTSRKRAQASAENVLLSQEDVALLREGAVREIQASENARAILARERN